MATRGIMQRWWNTTVDTTYTNATLAYAFVLTRSCWTVDGHAVQFTVHDTTNQLSTAAATAFMMVTNAVTPNVPRLQIQYRSSYTPPSVAPLPGPIGYLYDTANYPAFTSGLVFNPLGTLSDSGVFVGNSILKTRTDQFVLWIRVTVTRGNQAAPSANDKQLRIVLNTTAPDPAPGPVLSTIVSVPPIAPTLNGGAPPTNTVVAMSAVVFPARAVPVPGPAVLNPTFHYVGALAAGLFGGPGVAAPSTVSEAVFEWASADGLI